MENQKEISFRSALFLTDVATQQKNRMSKAAPYRLQLCCSVSCMRVIVISDLPNSGSTAFDGDDSGLISTADAIVIATAIDSYFINRLDCGILLQIPYTAMCEAALQRS